jgi:hypothetical protein
MLSIFPSSSRSVTNKLAIQIGPCHVYYTSLSQVLFQFVRIWQFNDRWSVLFSKYRILINIVIHPIQFGDVLFFFQNYAATMFFVSIHSIWETLVLFLDLVMCKLKELIIYRYNVYSISLLLHHPFRVAFFLYSRFSKPHWLLKTRIMLSSILFLRIFSQNDYLTYLNQWMD